MESRQKDRPGSETSGKERTDGHYLLLTGENKQT
jgi:hypothetical protein